MGPQFNSMVDCCACSSMQPGTEGECDTTDFCDSYGDCCDEYWYYPSWCGGYDTADFNSMVDCCACPSMQPGIEGECDTTDFCDSYGDCCDEYWYYPSWCGGKDTPQFNSMMDCCACQYDDKKAVEFKEAKKANKSKEAKKALKKAKKAKKALKKEKKAKKVASKSKKVAKKSSKASKKHLKK